MLETVIPRLRNTQTNFLVYTRAFLSRPGIRRETTTRETNTLISRMFTNHSRNHAQRSFVMFCAGVARAELWTVRKPLLNWLFYGFFLKVFWSKRLWSFINVASNVNKSHCQAQILILMSIPDCNFSTFTYLIFEAFQAGQCKTQTEGKMQTEGKIKCW